MCFCIDGRWVYLMCVAAGMCISSPRSPPWWPRIQNVTPWWRKQPQRRPVKQLQPEVKSSNVSIQAVRLEPLTVRPFSLQIWTISILGFLFKRLTFLAFSWASVDVITPHTEIPECQRFPGLRCKALSYVHPNIHSSSLESVEVRKFKARRVSLPWNDNCEFVFFFFSKGRGSCRESAVVKI